ncbi:Strong similarity to unknown protein T28M21.21 gi/2088661 from A. thaliana BAC gb/AF002109 [Arabidopsis thaliana]|uniref:F8K4.4 protein n=1 Tax=Arabidopsis thaliana TaxID=3702 RepID=O80691_ARATH|nr:Strong similarity to unknown protein T28M21.21 gi/2088661 from A. thaliana BAC gb/AF002109 [Arabidopsis thaliana]
MDNDRGIFHMMEKDGKLSLVYRPPIIQTRSPTSSGRIVIRWKNRDFPYTIRFSSITNVPFGSIINYVRIKYAHDDHFVLPLFWCNDKEFDVNGGCSACNGSYFGTDYYFCNCNKMYHKECVESPLKIKHPYHPEHSLECYIHPPFAHNIECLCCGRIASGQVYYCSICRVLMHSICAMKTIPMVINQPKRHDHPLIFFPKQNSLTCNVCGLLRKLYSTYICAICNFVAHKDCMYSPRIIKISHCSCTICRQSIDSDYGAYSCAMCGDYVVHSRCALGKDVWDGEDLENVPEEDNKLQDVTSFDIISDGVILHFLHDHHLRLKVSILYDENKFCQACVLPIVEGNFYSCMECDFIFHETCPNSCRILLHALHPHQLTLEHVEYDSCRFMCNACERFCGGFIYGCHIRECKFYLDVRCASIYEPFNYKYHEHSMFLASDPKEELLCQVCKTICHKQLNCIKCDFIVCIKCATLPEKVRYKHDKHFLRVLFGEELCKGDWCEVCERNLRATDTKVFYWCNECGTTFHIECLFGGDLIYVKPGQTLKFFDRDAEILGKSNLSRPLCMNPDCKNPCQVKILKTYNDIVCSVKCGNQVFY